MSDGMRCVYDSTCELGLHVRTDHPCGQRSENAGDRCRYCNQVVPDPPPCPKCWQPMTLADLKGLAAEHGWETTVTIGKDGT